MNRSVRTSRLVTLMFSACACLAVTASAQNTVNSAARRPASATAQLMHAGPVIMQNGRLHGSFHYTGHETRRGGACLLVQTEVKACSSGCGTGGYCIDDRCWTKLGESYCNKVPVLNAPAMHPVPATPIAPPPNLAGKPWRVQTCLTPATDHTACRLSKSTRIVDNGPVYQKGH